MDGMRIGREVAKMADKQTSVLCLKYSTHSTGFDFFNVKNVIMLSPAVNKAHAVQAMGRVQRMAQEHATFRLINVVYGDIESEVSLLQRTHTHPAGPRGP
jgi:superfamily II DNA or RNA helicase